MSPNVLEGRDVVTSTMDIAREKALAGQEPGYCIWADYQTLGRGRQGRVWFAPSGANVCMTVIGGRVSQNEAWQVALLAGVVAVEVVRSITKLTATVRFPNDIYYEGKKLGGILIETVPHIKKGYVIPLIGIGINVNVSAEDFTPELRARATSILCETESEFSVASLTGVIVGKLCFKWNDFKRGSLEEAVLPRWRELADADARRTFHLDGADQRCRVVDIGGDGMVTLETEAGERRTIHAAQVILGDD